MNPETLEIIEALKQVNSGVDKTIISVMGGVIVVCFTIIGFFLSRIVSDVKNNTLNIGRNKGSIELVEQQQKSDVKRIEQTTQQEIQSLGEKVGALTDSVNKQSDNVNQLVKLMIKNANIKES